MRPACGSVVVLLAVGLLLSLSSAQGQTGHALLIASGEFAPGARVPPLRAPVNDVRLLASLLEWRCGFAPRNIVLVGVPAGSWGAHYRSISPRATFEAVQDGFLALARRVRVGDVVVLYYSGHGTQIVDVSGDEPDLNDEAWVTYGATSASLVLDDQINAWLQRLKGARVTLVVDACYSGSAARAMAGLGVPKYAPLADRSVSGELRAPQEVGVLPADSPYVLLAACGGAETAEELRLPASAERPAPVAVSAFTRALYHTLCWEREALTCGELLDRVTQRLRLWRRPQTPHQEGGSERWVAFPSVGRRRVAGVPVRAAAQTEAELGIGWLAGVRRGMVFGDPDAGDRSPLLQVTRADWFTAPLRVLRAGRPLPSFAVPRFVPPLAADPLRVQVVSKGESQAVAWSLDLPDIEWTAPVAPLVEEEAAESADLALTVEAGPADSYRVTLVRPDGLNAQELSAATAEEVAARLQTALRAQQARRELETWENPARPFGLRLWSERGITPTYRVGETARFFIQSRREGYLLLFALEPNQTMTLLFPNPYHLDNHIEADSVYAVPSLELYPFEIEVAEPPGDSVVVALVTDRPLRLPEALLPDPSLPGSPLDSLPAEQVEVLSSWLRRALAEGATGEASSMVEQDSHFCTSVVSATAVDIARLVARVVQD